MIFMTEFRILLYVDQLNFDFKKRKVKTIFGEDFIQSIFFSSFPVQEVSGAENSFQSKDFQVMILDIKFMTEVAKTYEQQLGIQH